MTSKKLTCCFILTMLLLNGTSEAQTKQRTIQECKIQTQKRTLQPGKKLVRLAGTVAKKGTMEYHIKVTADLTVDVQLKDSQLKLDIYSLVPPTPIQKKVAQWTGSLSPKNEYTLIVNNCSGNTNAKYQLEISVR